MNSLVQIFRWIGINSDPIITMSAIVTCYGMHIAALVEGPEKSEKLFYMYLHGMYVWPAIYVILGLKFLTQREEPAGGFLRFFLCSCMTECCVPQKKSLIMIA